MKQEKETPGTRQSTGGEEETRASHPNIIPGGIARDSGGADQKELFEFLAGWSEHGPWWPTAIPREGGRTETATFTDLGKLAAWVAARNGDKNIYFSVNDLSANTQEKASKDEVTRIRGLHADVDPRPMEGGADGKTPEELAAHFNAERARIRAMADDWECNGKKLPFPRPTAIVDSGGGYQFFWCFDDDEEVSPELAEAFNRIISAAMGGDNTHDVSRIMRLPGTMNLASEKKRQRGRSDAPARLAEADFTRRFRLSDFPDPPKATAEPRAAAVSLPADLPDVSLDDLPDAVSARTKMLITNGGDPDDPGRYPSRSEVLFAVLCEMVRADCSDEQMAAVILDREYPISEHVHGQPNPEQYAARQIEKARAVAHDPLLANLNLRHVVLENEQGRTRVLEFVRSPIGGQARNTVTLQSFEDFRNRYMNVQVEVATDKEGNPVKKPLGDTWLRWQHRRQNNSLVFAPCDGEEVGEQLNLWRGYGVTPVPADWRLMRAHIRDVLAGGDETAADYIVRWAAFAVQNPAVPAEVALVFRGKKGTGKGLFARALIEMFGQHGLHIGGGRLLTGRFNLHLRDCCLLFADEVEWRGDRDAEAALKVMVTEPTLTIEGKGTNSFQSPNHLHIVMASNEDWVVPASIDERRFAAFGVSDAQQGNKLYFSDLVAEVEAGGLAAMLHYLLAIDLGDWHPRWNIPATDELAAQKLASLSGASAVMFEVLMRGETPLVERDDGRWPTLSDGARVFIPTGDLTSWAVARRLLDEVRPGLSERIGHEMRRAGGVPDRTSVQGRQARGWWLPALPEARLLWAESRGLVVAWGEGEDADWDVVRGVGVEPDPEMPF